MAVRISIGWWGVVHEVYPPVSSALKEGVCVVNAPEIKDFYWIKSHFLAQSTCELSQWKYKGHENLRINDVDYNTKALCKNKALM